MSHEHDWQFRSEPPPQIHCACGLTPEEEVARLAEQLEAARGNMRWSRWKRERERAEAAETEVAKLRVALERYGQHDAYCGESSGGDGSGKCNCGFRVALASTPKEPECEFCKGTAKIYVDGKLRPEPCYSCDRGLVLITQGFRWEPEPSIYPEDWSKGP